MQQMLGELVLPLPATFLDVLRQLNLTRMRQQRIAPDIPKILRHKGQFGITLRAAIWRSASCGHSHAPDSHGAMRRALIGHLRLAPAGPYRILIKIIKLINGLFLSRIKYQYRTMLLFCQETSVSCPRRDTCTSSQTGMVAPP